MDLKGDLENDLKRYLDAPPSQAILPLSSSNYDLDDDGNDDDDNDDNDNDDNDDNDGGGGDDDDNGPPPGIQGFEMDSDPGEDDGDSRLSLWPRHHNDPRPKPHPLDESGVFCREWGRPSAIMKRGFRGVPLAAPLVPQNLFGRQREAIFSKPEVDERDFPEPPQLLSSEADPIVFNARIRSDGEILEISRDFGRGICLGNFDHGLHLVAHVTIPSEHNSPSSSEASMDESGTSTLVESPSDTLVGSPQESPSRAISRISSHTNLPTSESAVSSPISEIFSFPTSHDKFQPLLPIAYDRSLTTDVTMEPDTAELPSPKPDRNTLLPVSLGGEKLKRQHIICAEGSRNSGGGESYTLVLDAAGKRVAPRMKRAQRIRNPRPFPCPAPWCIASFTRENDAERHFKNAAIHRDAANPDSSTRCRKCGEELSRLDARKRHELKDACGKRRIVRKPPGPRPFVPA